MNTVAMVGLSLAEMAKLILHLYFAHMALAGRTDEEQDAFYQEVKKGFFERHPSKLKKPE